MCGARLSLRLRKVRELALEVFQDFVQEVKNSSRLECVSRSCWCSNFAIRAGLLQELRQDMRHARHLRLHSLQQGCSLLRCCDVRRRDCIDCPGHRVDRLHVALLLLEKDPILLLTNLLCFGFLCLPAGDLCGQLENSLFQLFDVARSRCDRRAQSLQLAFISRDLKFQLLFLRDCPIIVLCECLCLLRHGSLSLGLQVHHQLQNSLHRRHPGGESRKDSCW
mmetsp:Transcript_146845/g.267692  ORF Transcript_146845/g.267692 Transcript_146845/m.267692 type:complete len:222 (+) Transcript_146845:1365-2030(+)